nr:hypothetical protein [Micromonospora sp. DSM 115978]
AARTARRQLVARDARGWAGCDLVVAALRAVDIDLLVALGNPKAALDTAHRWDGAHREAGSARTEPTVALATSRALLAVGDPVAAAALLAPLLRADAGVGVGDVVAACVLDAVCAARGAADGRAAASLARALALAADEELLGPFLDGGDEVTELLTVHASLRSTYPDFTRSVFAGRSALYLQRTASSSRRLVPPARSVAGSRPGRSVPSAAQAAAAGRVASASASAGSTAVAGVVGNVATPAGADPHGAPTVELAADHAADLASGVVAPRPPAPRRTGEHDTVGAHRLDELTALPGSAARAAGGTASGTIRGEGQCTTRSLGVRY